MRRKIALISAVALAATGGAIVVANVASAASGCSAKYAIVSSWPGGFQAQVDVTNLGDATTSWNVGWDFGNSSQTITQIWNANKTQSGLHVNATSLNYNGNLATNGVASFGFTGAWSGSNPAGTNFTLNGTACTGGTTGGPSSQSPSASTSPSNPGNGTPAITLTSPTTGSTFTAPATIGLAATASVSGSTISKVDFYNGSTLLGTDTSSPYTYSWTNVAAGNYSVTAKATAANGNTATTSAAAISVTTTGGGGTHVDNPYVGAKVYVNPDWSSKAAAESGGSRISNQPTGVWLDSIAAITAPSGSGYTTSLAKHLDNALAQGATLAQFVIYDLPGRDCAALASNGELGPTEIGRYKTDYIDQIAARLANPAFASLRIVTIIEIDSLPNLVTNASGQAGATSQCATMLQNGNYVAGIQYALSKLHAIPNVYTYIDAAHHGWIGWQTNFNPAADLFTSTARGATGGLASVDGFITNTANYSALSEVNFNINTTVGGQSIRQAKWVDFNDFVDELTFTQAFRTKLVSEGFASNLGMLIDTSRNGWGGTARPAGPSTSTDPTTFVDQSRIDRRIHAGNWCNQSGAGMGERPRATPAAGIDAYVWIKPPGESDGSSSLIPTGPQNPGGKGFDQMCDPAYGGNPRNNNSPTGSLANAPVSGAWFAAQFQQLMANAFPAL
jgi:cellulose 1,4-beta-cellobiosidase